MKQTRKMMLIAGVLLFTAFGAGLAQDYAKMERSKRIGMNGESQKTEVKIQATDEYNFMRISIMSQFSQGEALFELIDPKGKVMGNYTLKTDSKVEKGKNTSYDESVSGELEKVFRNPVKGDWVVRITPKNATGNVAITSSQIFEPRADMLEIEQIEHADKKAKSNTIK